MNQQQRERAKDYWGLFARNPIGQRVIKDLEDAFDKSCFDENPYIMAHKEGQRDVILYIRERMVEADVVDKNT